MGLDALRYAASRVRGMARPPVTVTEPPPGIRIERDVEVPVRDGTVLRVNVFRPEDADGPLPVIMCAHPYGKDKLPKATRRGYRPDLQYRILRQPGPVSFSALTTWESPDPGWWVPRGYALVNCDLRGCGRSDGRGRLLSKQEGEDYHDLIEWAGTREWSNGRVGLLGVSYLALTQYRAAAERPEHLAAICPWEGFSNAYEDLLFPGGVREDGFVVFWSREIAKQRVDPDVRAEQLAHPDFDETWRATVPEIERIEAPMLVCGSFSDRNLHTRGSFRAFERVSSERKWLYTHRGGKWTTFYSPVAMAAQARFFDRFLKDEENGMDDVPPVRLEVREDRETVHEVREEQEWPLARTEWTELFLAPGGGLGLEPAAEGTAEFETRNRGGIAFAHRFERETELSGPMSLHLSLELRRAGVVNLFVAVDKYRDGRRVPFEGSYGFGLDHVAGGWRRVSVAPGEVAGGEVELPPSATLFRAGEELRLTVRGRWPWRRNPFTGALPAAYEPSPAATCVLRLGDSGGARLLIPVIP